MRPPRRLYRVRWTGADWSRDAWGGLRWQSKYYVMRSAAERRRRILEDEFGYQVVVDTTPCGPWEIVR